VFMVSSSERLPTMRTGIDQSQTYDSLGPVSVNLASAWSPRLDFTGGREPSASGTRSSGAPKAGLAAAGSRVPARTRRWSVVAASHPLRRLRSPFYGYGGFGHVATSACLAFHGWRGGDSGCAGGRAECPFMRRTICVDLRSRGRRSVRRRHQLERARVAAKLRRRCRGADRA
jgi:hypothetical protein